VGSIARESVVMLLVAGMVSLPAMASAPGAAALPNAASVSPTAANEKPLGMVVLATNAHVDSADATMGANVYGGDVLDTSSGGTLRLKVGNGQLYLLGDSAATLVPEAEKAHANLTRGVMGFSGSSADGIEIETPIGIVRAAAGQARAFGQVTLRNEKEMIVTSYAGTLEVEREGEVHEIPEGKTYSVTMANAEPQKYGVVPGRKDKDKLALTLIIVGGTALAGTILWCVESESNYAWPCH
jgi:hypothetical protein